MAARTLGEKAEPDHRSRSRRREEQPSPPARYLPRTPLFQHDPHMQTQATSHLPPHPPGLQPPPTTGREIQVSLPRPPLPPQAALHPSPPRITSSSTRNGPRTNQPQAGLAIACASATEESTPPQ